MKLILKSVAFFAGVFCMAATAHAFDNLQSQQAYLQAVNSEAMRLKPYSVAEVIDATQSDRGISKDMNVDDMLLRLKKLTAHAGH